jgi:pyruvate formate lyase activating enzyme
MQPREKGLVFDIQKFCVNDGPGIRTGVFLKGCNLRCLWCQNPESILPQPEVSYLGNYCIHCGACIKVCPHDAILSSPDLPTLNRELCQKCMACVQECPTKALRTAGQWMTVEEVMEKVDEDRVFYENSGGGVTFSGGEPVVQFEFLKALLEESGRRHLHRVLETNGHYPWEQLDQLLPNLELVLFDIKHLDNQVHQQYTGAGNRLIRGNLELLARKGGVDWFPRVPLIPGVNDSSRHLKELGRWVKGLGAREIHLLPYHRFWESKQRAFGYPRELLLEKINPPLEEEVKKAAKMLSREGFPVIIGG